MKIVCFVVFLLFEAPVRANIGNYKAFHFNSKDHAFPVNYYGPPAPPQNYVGFAVDTTNEIESKEANELLTTAANANNLPEQPTEVLVQTGVTGPPGDVQWPTQRIKIEAWIHVPAPFPCPSNINQQSPNVIVDRSTKTTDVFTQPIPRDQQEHRPCKCTTAETIIGATPTAASTQVTSTEGALQDDITTPKIGCQSQTPEPQMNIATEPPQVSNSNDQLPPSVPSTGCGTDASPPQADGCQGGCKPLEIPVLVSSTSTTTTTTVQSQPNESIFAKPCAPKSDQGQESPVLNKPQMIGTYPPAPIVSGCGECPPPPAGNACIGCLQPPCLSNCNSNGVAPIPSFDCQSSPACVALMKITRRRFLKSRLLRKLFAAKA